MRVKHARNCQLESSFVLVSLLQRSLALLQEQVRVVLAGKLANLNEEISQVFFERGDVLVQVEQTRNCDLDLVVGQVRECRSQEVGHKVLNKRDVGARQRNGRHDGVEMDCDLVGLDQREHVSQDGGMHRQSGGVGRVRHHAEHVLKDVGVVCLQFEMKTRLNSASEKYNTFKFILKEERVSLLSFDI